MKSAQCNSMMTDMFMILCGKKANKNILHTGFNKTYFYYLRITMKQ